MAISATSLTLDAGMAVGAAGNALRISAATVTAVDANGAVRLDVAGATTICRLTAGGVVDVDGTGTVSTSGALSGSGVSITSSGGAVLMGQNSTIEAGNGDVTLDASSDVTVAYVAGDDVVLNSAGGSLLSSKSGVNVEATTLSGVIGGAVGAGAHAPIVLAVDTIGSLTAGGLLAVESTTAMSIGTLSGVGAVSLEAGAAVTLTGSISGEGLAITTTGAGSAGDFTMTSGALLDAGNSQVAIAISGNATIAQLSTTADATVHVEGDISAVGGNSLISASVLYMTAGGSLGSSAKAVAIEAPVISAFSAGSDIDATFTGATTLQGGDAGGSIDISADAALAITDMLQSTGAQNISAASVAFVVGATTGSLQLNGAADVSVTATAGDVTMDDGATLISTSGNIGVDASGS
ncbi:beta strand repeat-containing protein, partial [Falsiroseomonas stagni]|uniref:beta strand repeat-containing protein n=1 Tax=Falsiroseomonas stagni TaxID=484882 RepID=UPI00111335EE